MAADCESDPEMKAFLRKLAASWKYDATKGLLTRSQRAEKPSGAKPGKGLRGTSFLRTHGEGQLIRPKEAF
jgi:hypothetical protein